MCCSYFKKPLFSKIRLTRLTYHTAGLDSGSKRKMFDKVLALILGRQDLEARAKPSCLDPEFFVQLNACQWKERTPCLDLPFW